MLTCTDLPTYLPTTYSPTHLLTYSPCAGMQAHKHARTRARRQPTKDPRTPPTHAPTLPPTLSTCVRTHTHVLLRVHKGSRADAQRCCSPLRRSRWSHRSQKMRLVGWSATYLIHWTDRQLAYLLNYGNADRSELCQMLGRGFELALWFSTAFVAEDRRMALQWLPSPAP